jgi:hypothetical protein
MNEKQSRVRSAMSERGRLIGAAAAALAVGLCGATATAGDAPVRILDVEAYGDVLSVQLQVDAEADLPGDIDVIVETADGFIVAAASVPPVSGELSVELPGALHHVQEDGWFYRATAQTSDGASLDALGFDVVLECPAGSGECGFQARSGVGAAPNTVVLSPELAKALTVATELGGDPLQTAVEMNPALFGEALTYGARLGAQVLTPAAGAAAPAAMPKTADWDSPIEPAPPWEPQCVCFWQGAQFLRPPSAERHQWSASPKYYDGWRGPGATHTLRAWYDGGLFNSTHDVEKYIESETELRLSLTCVEILGWVEFRIRLPFGGEIVIPFPIIGGECPKPCAGVVDSYSEYYANVHASVDGGWFGDAQGAAQDEALFSVNGTPRYNRIARVGKEVRRNFGFSLNVPGLATVTYDSGTFKVDGKPSEEFKAEIHYEVTGSDGGKTANIVTSASDTRVEPVTALLQSKVTTYARGYSDDDSEGKSANAYILAMHGLAPCAIEPRAVLYSYNNYYESTDTLRINLQSFFAQFGAWVNP